ncbi:MAG: hypothetical protein KDF24_01480 [Rhodocyclaceae bacterium]|nr:hypothetical protein [Rhodocyclaceae bacterium]MCB1961831.1 hypothetical protein [Rhodocyclaceae bacterium]
MKPGVDVDAARAYSMPIILWTSGEALLSRFISLFEIAVMMGRMMKIMLIRGGVNARRGG